MARRKCMAKAMTRGKGRVGRVTAGLSGILLFGFGGCAGEPPKPAPTVTSDQVRSHADKAFEKLKQEEQNRAVAPAESP
jgi:hypothetical protein